MPAVFYCMEYVKIFLLLSLASQIFLLLTYKVADVVVVYFTQLDVTSIYHFVKEIEGQQCLILTLILMQKLILLVIHLLDF